MQRSGLIKLIESRDAKLASRLKQSIDQTQTSARALPEQLNNALADPAGRSKIKAVISGSERSAVLLKQAAEKLS
jgi:hypothetical protein